MKIKTLIVLVGILAALSVVVFVVRRPDAPVTSDPRIGQSLVDPARIETAARVRVSDQGKTVTLVRQSDGVWEVENYHGLPADFSKLSELVNALSEAKLIRFVSARPEIVARLGFGDAKIELLDTAAKELWSVALGKQAESGGRYVRLGSEPKAYLAGLSVWLDATPKNWADSRLLALKADDIATIEIPFAGGDSAILSRDKPEASWVTDQTPAGQKVSASKVSSLLSSLTQLRFSDTADLKDPAASVALEHARTLKLTTFDGKSYAITLGRKPEEKKLKTPSTTEGTPDFTKNSPVNPDGSIKPVIPAKPELPEFDTIPAGPVFVSITSSDEKASVNALMCKCSFQVAEYVFTGLPQKSDELFDSTPPPPTTPPAAESNPSPAKP